MCLCVSLSVCVCVCACVRVSVYVSVCFCVCDLPEERFGVFHIEVIGWILASNSVSDCARDKVLSSEHLQDA